jgi:imidazole glycerol phosphate synthase subunit HisF
VAVRRDATRTLEQQCADDDRHTARGKRDPGVDVEATSDEGGGQNIGWITDGDYFGFDSMSLTGIDAVEWAHRAAELGAGEILLNSMDADGTRNGYDTVMIEAIRQHVGVPVIASGGAGRLDHFPPAIDAGAAAVLAASVFHFGALRIGQVKDSLRAAGHPVR